MLTLGPIAECNITAHADCVHLVPDFCGMSMEMANKLLADIKTINNTRRPAPASRLTKPPPARGPADRIQVDDLEAYGGQRTPQGAYDRPPPDLASDVGRLAIGPDGGYQPQPQQQRPPPQASNQYPSQDSGPSSRPPPPPSRPSASDVGQNQRPTQVPTQVGQRYPPAPQQAFAQQHQSTYASQQLPQGAYPHPQSSGPQPGQVFAQPGQQDPRASDPRLADPRQADPRLSQPLPPLASQPVQQYAQPGPPARRPTTRQRRIGLDDFNFLAVLGKGNFGKVMLAEEKKTSQLYAIKVLKKEFIIENDEVESTKSEKRVFLAAARERHPFLLALHSCFQTETRIYFVMEYVSGGDLMLHIQREQFTPRRAKFYAAEVLLALEYFHQSGIVYRCALSSFFGLRWTITEPFLLGDNSDLKLDNILLTLDGHVKVADYGLCKEDMWLGSTTSTFCGTPEFMAPEVRLLSHKYLSFQD